MAGSSNLRSRTCIPSSCVIDCLSACRQSQLLNNPLAVCACPQLPQNVEIMITCKMLVDPEASILSHFLMPTAVNWALPAGNCSGSCKGTCSGLLGLCKLSPSSLLSSVCDRDRRKVTAAWLLALPYSAPEFFLTPAGLEALVALPLLLFRAGCFRTADAPVLEIGLELSETGVLSGTMVSRSWAQPFNALTHAFHNIANYMSATTYQSSAACINLTRPATSRTHTWLSALVTAGAA